MKRILFVALVAALVMPMAAMAADKTITIAADPQADAFTSGDIRRGAFNVSVSGASWSGTVTLQRSFDRVSAAGANDAAKDAAATWRDVATYTANAEDIAYEPEGNVYYRIGMKNGDYSAGSVTVRIGK
ncbi:MAG: hypothetical protein ACOWWM_12700 [Desulfobacterales bacterium]